MKNKPFNYNILKTLNLIIMLCLYQQSPAQLAVLNVQDSPYTSATLFSDLITGQGIEILEVQYEGSDSCLGYFTGGENVIDISDGLILSTGKAASYSDIIGPFGAPNIGNVFASANYLSSATDPDMDSMSFTLGQIFNLGIYTILFRPNGDSINLRYVFASEEYPEYACSSFFDPIGFFLSGPGINGNYENGGINIATIPGTDINVSHSNIHPLEGTQCMDSAYEQYYNDNNLSFVQPVYDGFLDVFDANAKVIPGEVYTLKIAIADGGDSAFDSAIFLEAGSFNSGWTPAISISTLATDNTIRENCEPAFLTIHLHNPLLYDTTFVLSYTGTALYGTDYTAIAGEFILPAGDSILTVEIYAFEDNLTETPESIGIIRPEGDTVWLNIIDNFIWYQDADGDGLGNPLVDTSSCSLPAGYVTNFDDCNDLINYGPVMVSLNNTHFCTGEIAILNAEVNDGSFQWFHDGESIPGETDSTLLTTEPGDYYIEVIHTDGCITYSIPVEVYYAPAPAFVMITSEPAVLDFCGIAYAYVTPAYPYWTYQWSNNSSEDNLTISEAGLYSITVSNDFGCSNTAEAVFVYNPESLPFITSNNQNVLTVSNTYQDDSWQWFLNNEIIPEANNSVYHPTQSGIYTCQVFCEDSNIYVFTPPFEFIVTSVLPSEENLKVSILPNPAASYFIVALGVESQKNGNIKVYNAQGNLVEQRFFDKNTKHSSFYFDTKKYSSGLYAVTIQLANRVVQENLLIVK